MHDDKRPDPLDTAEHRLDELLREARWPAMQLDAEQRLRSTWRAHFARAPRRRLWAVSTLAAAAAIVTLVLGGWWMLRPPSEQPPQLASPGPVEQDHPVRQTSATSVSREPAVRDPTPFERLLANSSKRRPEAPGPAVASQSTAAPEWVPRDDEHSRIMALLRSHDPRDHDRFLQLVLDPSARPIALDALRHAPQPPVDALMQQLSNPHAERRLAAARALGEVCQPEVVERLWRMVSHNVHRREALAALTQCHEPQAGRYLAIAHENPSLESQLRTIRQQMNQIF